MKQAGFALALFFLSTSILQAQKTQHLRELVSSKKGSVMGLPLQVTGIPTGTFINGDSSNFASSRPHQVLVSEFYISTTEVTNAQYKEFTNWVRDSVAAHLLGGKYLTINKKTGDTSVNWKLASHINYSAPDNVQKLASILLTPAQTLSHRYEVDPTKLSYVIEGFNYQEAAKKENQGRNPNEFRFRYEVQIYPDTLVWMRDFGYSNNEQMALSYFSSPKFKNYPVVGVNWKQANAYCDWFTKQRIYAEQRAKKMTVGGVCRLPTEAEWAYAASLNFKPDPPKKVRTHKPRVAPKKKKNSKVNLVQNQTDSLNNNYAEEDNNIYDTTGNTLFPQNVTVGDRGKLGIFALSDNVSEWTNTSYYESAQNFENRFNPDIQWGEINNQSKSQRRKVICGGSWKDMPRFKTIYNRFYDDMNEAHSYIGFRVVVNLPQ